jgi:hypothetical protein
MRKTTTIRLSEEDRALIERLKARYGIESTTQLIRLALRMMDERKPGGEKTE